MKALTTQEKVLYHQIHPAKLAVDLGVTPVALYLLWTHELIRALVVSFIPSIVASILIIRFVNLARYVDSSFGRYVKRYMTRGIEAVRFAGFILMAVGAWLHLWWMIPAGVAVVLFGWFRGVIWPESRT